MYSETNIRIGKQGRIIDQCKEVAENKQAVVGKQ